MINKKIIIIGCSCMNVTHIVNLIRDKQLYNHQTYRNEGRFLSSLNFFQSLHMSSVQHFLHSRLQISPAATRLTCSSGD